MKNKILETPAATDETNILDHIPAVVFFHDILQDGSTRRIYRAGDYEYVFGWSRPELATDGTLDGFAVDQDVPWKSLIQRAIDAGQTTHEWRMRQPDGSFRWIRTHLRLLHREAGAPAVVVGYDINVTTELAAREAAILSARRASLGELAAGLAHEVNQPLTVMALAARNAIRQLESRGAHAIPQVIERLLRIETQAARSRDIVDHLRIFARDEEPHAKAQAFLVLPAIDVAQVLAASAMRDVGIRLEVDCAEPTIRAFGHPTVIEQVVLNLLLNARDAIVASGRTDGLIRVAVKVEGASVEVAVSDNGGGIPDHVRPRLFEAFFTTKPPGKGVGLGLSFAHEAVARMGGDLTAGNVGEGAVFRVTLPRAQG